jgi:hemoglobin/transferrin/lactoferrin receptor protein
LQEEFEVAKRHIARALVAAGIAFGGAGPALGQITGPSQTAEAPTSPPATGAEVKRQQPSEVITVTATRNPRPAFDYPGQVSVLDRSALETYAPSDLDDVLRAMPGVDVRGGPRRTGQTVSMRGLSGDNVLILIDGARQSFISAHDGRVFLDPELLQSVEAVRGPASALYGSGAVGGVLAFRTARAADLLSPDQTFGYRVRAGYEDGAEDRFAVGSVYGRSGALDGLVSLGGRRSGDITLASGLELPADDDIATWLGNVGLALAGVGEARFAAQGFRNIAVEPNNGQGARIGGGSGLDADVKKTVDTDTWRINGRLNPVRTPWLDLSLVAYESKSSVKEQELRAPRLVVREIQTTGVSIDNRTRFDLFGVSALLTLGADWWRDEQIGRDTTGPAGTRDGVPDGESAFTGAFAQLEIESRAPFGAPGALTLIPGMRYDSYKNSATDNPRGNSDERVSGRISARYAPTESFFAYGVWAQGFRTPSINELYLDGIHFAIPLPPGPPGRPRNANNVFAPNPTLRPEVSDSLEAGFGFDFDDVLDRGDKLRFKIGWWRADVKDLIAIAVIGGGPIATCFIPPRFSPCNAGTTESRNVQNAELKGVEAEFGYTAGPMSLSGVYSNVDGQDTRSRAPVGVLTPPRFIGDLRYAVAPANLTLGLRTEIAGAFDKTNTPAERRGAYTLFDFYATWRPLPALRIDAGVDNIADEIAERVFAGVPEPGRSARIAVTWSQGF